MPMNETQLLNLLEKTLGYEGVVYNQSLYTTDMNAFDNNFIFEYKHTKIPDDSLLFFVPCISSNESGNCKLTIRVPYKQNESDTTYSYKNEVKNIIVETNNGVTRPAKKNDIIAYRMCIFRFRKGSNNIVLCNSPLYDDALFSSLKVTDCEFTNVPTVKNNENVQEKITLVTSKELQSALARIQALEEKFVFGTADPEEVSASFPSGTIYIQIEDEE